VGGESDSEVEDFRAASHDWPFCSSAESASTLAVRVRRESSSSSFCWRPDGRARGGGK
jgi:hypothetical protein